MSTTERIINNLNVAKSILCNPQMLTPEMCVRVGQTITSAIDLLKEQEPQQVVITTNSYGTKFNHCPRCNRDLYTYPRQNYCSNCGQKLKWDEYGESGNKERSHK